VEDEFSFINSIKPKHTHQPSLFIGIGDDAALFAGSEAFEEIICMDTMVEDIHFKRATMKPYDVGYKALAANISDVAAMGGYPTYYLVSVAVPEYWREDLHELYRGMENLAQQYNVDLIGGDTTSAKESLVLTVTALGRVEKQRHLLRRNAKKGDLVFVTGTLGNSAAGLSLLQQHGLDYAYSSEEKSLIEAHQRPQPKVEAGRLLSSFSQNIALNDISDGIASEANEIAEASEVKLILDYEKLPVSKSLQAFPAKTQEESVLYGGEDFELIGTVPREQWEQLQVLFQKKNQPVTIIGMVEEGSSKVLLKKDGDTHDLKRNGYNHFR
jgi:thiamine-monophosphate kinase